MPGRNMSCNKAKATYTIGNTELYSVVYKLTRKKSSEKSLVITIMLVKLSGHEGGCLYYVSALDIPCIWFLDKRKVQW